MRKTGRLGISSLPVARQHRDDAIDQLAQMLGEVAATLNVHCMPGQASLSHYFVFLKATGDHTPAAMTHCGR